MNLNTLTDTNLLNSAKTLIGKERNAMVDLLWHLVEIEKRDLHLSLGYSSMFDYLVRGLKFSESAAARRLKAARCMKENSSIEKMLKAGKLSLSTVCKASEALSLDKNLIERFSGVSARTADLIAAEYKAAPKKKIKDKIKPLGRVKLVPTDSLFLKIVIFRGFIS